MDKNLKVKYFYTNPTKISLVAPKKTSQQL